LGDAVHVWLAAFLFSYSVRSFSGTSE